MHTQNNDLTVGTANQIFSASDKIFGRSEALYQVNDEFISASELCDRMTSFKLAADYYRYIRTEQNIVRYNFTYVPTVIESTVSSDSAYVHIYTHISFQYQPNGKTAECSDNYIVYLLKIDGAWYIVDVESEELIAYGFTNLNETYSEEIAEFDNRHLNTASINTLTQPRSTTAYDRAYNANNAIAYAYTYAT